MADKSGLFNQKAMDKLRSPDDLDNALRIARPSVLAVLCACVIFILGFLSAFMDPVTQLIVLGQTIQEMQTQIARIDDVMCYPADVPETEEEAAKCLP